MGGPGKLGVSGQADDAEVAVRSTREHKKIAAHTHAFSSAFLHDLENLPKTSLRDKYSGEANSHRNMKRRLSLKKIAVHPSFERFCDFLAIVGPKPTKGATLDRIDNADPEYAPGKVRWADRVTQNNNRSNTRTVYDALTGQTFTTYQLARRHKVSSSTIRKWMERGWTGDEIVAGFPFTRAHVTDGLRASERKRRLLYSRAGEIEEAWTEAFKAQFPNDIVIKLSAKERHLLVDLLERCPDDHGALSVMRVCVRLWDDFCRTAKSEQGAYGIPGKPTVEFLHRYAQTAVNFAACVHREELKNLTYSDPPGPKPVRLLHVKPRFESAGDERPATLDEVLAILRGEALDL